MKACEGQSTVEFAIVFAVFLAAFLAVAALWHAASSGTLVGLATDASSHSFGEGNWLSALADVLSF